jgi:hypothetical protein
MRSLSERFTSLASPAFIAALVLLVVNDFALKPLLHNALTGKLSDFAGLFALTWFVAAAWPRRRRLTAALVGAAFVFWKTGYSEPLIAWLDAAVPFAVGRTVDLIDLVALPMVPLALWMEQRLEPMPLPRALTIGLAVLAPVAFTATSRAPFVVRSTTRVSARSPERKASYKSSSTTWPAPTFGPVNVERRRSVPYSFRPHEHEKQCERLVPILREYELL